MIHRRDLLRLAAAGGAGLLLGCPKGAPPQRRGPPGGKIHGQDHALGHLLRTGDLRERPPEEEFEQEVLIVGAGVAGLTCAWRLRREGLRDEVLLLEAGARPGGNARGGENEVSPYPWGAHYLRAPTREHRSLELFLREVGLIRGQDSTGQLDWDTRAVCAAPLERLYEGGVWGGGLFPPPLSGDEADLAQGRRFAELVAELAAWRDEEGRPAFTIPGDLSSRSPEILALDQISFHDWLEREGLTSPALRWYVEYACRDDYGCTLETTSAWAGLHYFCARVTDDPSRDVILTWPEGNQRLVTYLIEAAEGPARIQTRNLCVGIDPGGGSEPARALVYEAERDRVVAYTAKQLVFAGPRSLLSRLLPQPLEHATAFDYSPWLVANVTLDQPPAGVGAGLAWDNVLFGQPSLGYVVANRQAGPGDPCVITWYRPFTHADPSQARRELLALDHAAIVSMALDELFETHPSLRGRVRSVDAWRWGHALVRPVPGFLWGADRLQAAQPVGNVLAAHSDQSGLPLFEEAFYRGVLAGEEALRRAGRTFESLV